MGCNQSKTEDIQKDRERQAQKQPAAQPAAADNTGASAQRPGPTRSSAQPMNMKGKQLVNDDPSIAQLGTSKTDRHMRDNEAFVKNIMTNLIDVSQQPAALPPKEAIERSKQYSSQIAFAGNLRDDNIARLPRPTLANPVELLKAPTIPSDHPFIAKYGKTVSTAFHSLHVKECGNIVVKFPEIFAH